MSKSTSLRLPILPKKRSFTTYLNALYSGDCTTLSDCCPSSPYPLVGNQNRSSLPPHAFPGLPLDKDRAVDTPALHRDPAGCMYHQGVHMAPAAPNPPTPPPQTGCLN